MAKRLDYGIAIYRPEEPPPLAKKVKRASTTTFTAVTQPAPVPSK